MLNSLQARVKNTPPAQYAIYIYHKTSDDHKLPKWKKIRESQSIKRALQCAIAIQRHGIYEKIEIKKRFFCPNEQKIIGKTIRILNNKEIIIERILKNILTQAQNT
ncbi:MAG: hypothetical protein ACRBDI_04940 [Alphaproteobacteria bacterium]